jgi:hypothetical protein
LYFDVLLTAAIMGILMVKYMEHWMLIILELQGSLE